MDLVAELDFSESQVPLLAGYYSDRQSTLEFCLFIDSCSIMELILISIILESVRFVRKKRTEWYWHRNENFSWTQSGHGLACLREYSGQDKMYWTGFLAMRFQCLIISWNILTINMKYLNHIEPKLWFQSKKGSPEKNSYERRDYESVDDKSLL